MKFYDYGILVKYFLNAFLKFYERVYGFIN